jgi:Phosphoesterase family
MRPHHLVEGLSVILLVSAAFAATTLNVSSAGNVTASAGRWFDYVVIIMLENHSINDTYGVSNPFWNNMSSTCLGNCSYFTSLANQSGLAEGYTNMGVSGGSQGDYIAITSGYGNSNCNGPAVPSCWLPIPNIVDSLETAHLTWKAYMEGYPIPSGCVDDFTGPPNNYGPNHNPFVYYTDIQNNTARCSLIVNANSIVANQTRAPNGSVCWPSPVNTDDLFLKDLNSVTSASNYMFLTPNTADDLHDCNDVSLGNAWMQNMIPQILSSTLFSTRRAALFITFDEPDCTFKVPGSANNCPPHARQLYTVWASNPTNPTTRHTFKSVNQYSHFSALKTIEDNWRLPPLVAANDGTATDMAEFLL